jgi:hypothetical protein
LFKEDRVVHEQSVDLWYMSISKLKAIEQRRNP